MGEGMNGSVILYKSIVISQISLVDFSCKHNPFVLRDLDPFFDFDLNLICTN